MPDEIVEPHSDYAPPEAKKEERPEKVRVIFVPWEEGTPEAKEWKNKSEQWNHVKEDKYEIVYYKPGATSEALKRVSADPNGSVYIRGHGSAGAVALVAKVDDKQISLALEDVCERLAAMGLEPKSTGSIKFHSDHSATVFKPELLPPKVEALQKTIAQAGTATRFMVQDQKEKNKAIKAKIGPFWDRDKEQVKELKKGEGILKTYKREEKVGLPEFVRQKELLMPTTTSIAKYGADLLREKGYKNCTYFGYLGPVESEYGSLDNNPTKAADWHKFVDLTPLHEPSEALLGEVKKGGYQLNK